MREREGERERDRERGRDRKREGERGERERQREGACVRTHTCAWVGANQVEGEEENEEINTIDVSAQVCTSSAHPQLSLIFSVQKSDFFTSFQRSSDSNQVVELE